MAVRARQNSYVSQPVNPEQQQVQQQRNKRKKSIITAKEKMLYIAFIVLVCALAVTILHKQSSIQQTTMEIQKIESEITELEKQNVNLKVQVSELSTYERIWEKAKELGLTLNEKNVKVVPGE
ncbi:cell division protein FtsL [Ureibacillus sinduriensis]|uniref:Cell division protein FtsL n=1 Tax=Ureibacillus sinduriensis BLB-1 = JCM 15800 TaxID=1384057 RepID=A0A0A3HMP6_9BACL|nr:cell division protein FtsL [Ureibacillus sinduriensis]KGR73801.1 cell division protein [Ureibacillus sinduriensis BLB-1 = JCM 15800]